MSHLLNKAPLGKQTKYISTYSPDLLFPIPRKEQRAELKNKDFQGVDVWNAYELSWLDSRGKPIVALGEFHIPSDSPNIVESKSLKLYLNSFNQTSFSSMQEVAETIGKDISRTVQNEVRISLKPLEPIRLGQLEGVCLDNLDVSIECYSVNPSLLKTEPIQAEEKLYTNLFKSNCLITGQPDWASVQIHYRGPKINHASLLQYLVSYRNHQGFHEHCTEQVYSDLIEYCQPEALTVIAPFTRRGGVSICCVRATRLAECSVPRLVRE